MFLEPFDGPRQLIKRARVQANELKVLIQTYRENLQIFFIPGDDFANLKTYHLHFKSTPPVECALVLREALNNLRVAVDITIADVARLEGKPENEMDQVKFPFAKDIPSLQGTLKRMKMGADFGKVIMTMHPLTGHNLWLRQLHDLDIISKHRIMVPVFAMYPGRLPISIPPEIMEMTVKAFGFNPFMAQVPWQEGSSISIPDGQDPRNHLIPLDDLDVCIPEPLPFAEKTASSLLSELSAYITDFVEFFNSIFNPDYDASIRVPLRTKLGI